MLHNMDVTFESSRLDRRDSIVNVSEFRWFIFVTRGAVSGELQISAGLILVSVLTQAAVSISSV